jgi:hypothetical protein
MNCFFMSLVVCGVKIVLMRLCKYRSECDKEITAA